MVRPVPLRADSRGPPREPELRPRRLGGAPDRLPLRASPADRRPAAKAAPDESQYGAGLGDADWLGLRPLGRLCPRGPFRGLVLPASSRDSPEEVYGGLRRACTTGRGGA